MNDRSPEPMEQPAPLLPREPRFWLALAALAVVVGATFFFKLGSWPWDHDEVAGLIEVGALDLPVKGAPVSQLDKTSRLLPVWYGLQRLFLTVLPADEFGSRVFSAVSGVLVVLSAFLIGWQWRGAAFATALVLVVGMSQGLVWLSQHNRFYSPALLFFTWSIVALWRPGGRGAVPAAVACVGLSVLAVLCHNLFVVVYGIFFIAAAMGSAVGATPRPVLLRSFLVAVAVGGIYVAYLRPILAGWVSGGTGGTHPVVSFVAMVGVPTLALTFLGGVLAWCRGGHTDPLVWWGLSLVGGLTFVAISPLLMGNWNPRYAILFMAPACVLAAYAVEAVALAFGPGLARVAVYACVAAMLAPKFVSHFKDGSRHDLRAAAAVAAKHAVGTDAVYCNWPMELAYYLRDHGPAPAVGWDKGAPLPAGPCVVVYASNAFEPVLQPAGRRSDVVAEVFARRFDEQSHTVRVYKIGPLGQGDGRP